ncbi:DUF3299 domain-containing protein [Pseudohalioglobus sediminis]|uniref:DUF3299 domain-containing protein n=1 Tax=Pseudohalioglobus sediminis TaxID=2606449 RepID=A0A5B0WRS7_9GAMM|nr:DUF3299 domain-containing protein [Pseudohalioglobus sediminis]KAA1189586.1 DUF3299 domain-containing protein [Pseudohalioglobus sediminis]
MIQHPTPFLTLLIVVLVGNFYGHTAAAADNLPEAQYRVLAWEELVPEDWEPPVIPRAHNEARATPVDPAAAVASLDQQLVALPGFMKPVVFAENQVSEFILVPLLPHHTQHHAHLDVNQMVYVKLLEPLRVENPMTPLWVIGTMTVQSVFTDEGPVAYRIADGVTTEYEY